jgi:hypothetical protein
MSLTSNFTKSRSTNFTDFHSLPYEVRQLADEVGNYYITAEDLYAIINFCANSWKFVQSPDSHRGRLRTVPLWKSVDDVSRCSACPPLCHAVAPIVRGEGWKPRLVGTQEDARRSLRFTDKGQLVAVLFNSREA